MAVAEAVEIEVQAAVDVSGEYKGVIAFRFLIRHLFDVLIPHFIDFVLKMTICPFGDAGNAHKISSRSQLSTGSQPHNDDLEHHTIQSRIMII